MKKIALVSRIVLGLAFTVFGLNGFLHFIPAPPPPENVANFVGALVNSGYLFQFIKGTETVTGLMILLGWQVPIALIILAPVMVNIVAFHFFMTGPTSIIGIPLGLALLQMFVAWTYKEKFIGIFK